jgi:hypothetical protein
MVSATMLVSCQKDTLELFEREPDVYFQALMDNNSGAWSSSVKFNFIVEDELIRFYPIIATGRLSNEFRPVSVIACPDSTTAIEGIHYEIVDSLTGIWANSPRGFVAVRLKKSIEHGREVQLRLQLEPNTHFNTEFHTIMNNTSERKERSMLHFNVFISNVLTKPAVWNTQAALGALGTYSDKKYRLVIELTGLSAAFWEGLIETDDGRRLQPADSFVAGALLKQYLYEQWMRGMQFRVEEDDGSYMEVPGLWDKIFGD